MHTAPDSNLGISLGGIEVFDLLVDFLESYFRVTFRSVQRYFTKLVSAWVIWILHELILLCLFKLLLEIVDRTSVRNVLLGGDVEFLLQLLDILFEVLYFDLKSRDLFSLDPSLANLAL